MMVLVSYDVSTGDKRGQARLRKVAKACEDYGIRVQNLVFECVMDPAIWVLLKTRLEEIYDPEQDSLRYYFLGANWEKRIEHLGRSPEINVTDTLIL